MSVTAAMATESLFLQQKTLKQREREGERERLWRKNQAFSSQWESRTKDLCHKLLDQVKKMSQGHFKLYTQKYTNVHKELRKTLL